MYLPLPDVRVDMKGTVNDKIRTMGKPFRISGAGIEQSIYESTVEPQLSESLLSKPSVIQTLF